jgi:hypothetical protein
MSMTTKPMSLQRASYIVAAFSLLGFSAFHCGFAAQSDFVRFSKPELLTFDQLVDLEKNDPPSPALAEKLEHLVTTPFLSNEAYFNGAKPNRPSSPQLGPFLRAICWNIERGIQFDPIRIALSSPKSLTRCLLKERIPKPSL